MNKRILVASIVVVGALLATIWIGNGLVVAQAPILPIQSASAADLALQGVVLRQPGSTATVARTQAVAAAQARFPRAQIREVFLAQLADTNTQPNIDLLCWGVSLVLPANEIQTKGPMPGLSRSAPKYLIFFFDAHTGAFVEGISAG
jgi:hypothetical protein